MPRIKTIERWRPGLAFWTALVFVAVAVAAVFLYDHHKLRAWTPNIATSAASIAITVTVINGIVRSEARRRIRPRVAAALQSIGHSVQTFSRLVALDYGSSHESTFKPIPKTAPEMLALWAAEWDTNDWDSSYLDLIITEGHELADTLEQARARDFDVLEPDLVHAIDEFCLHMMQIGNWHKLVKAGIEKDRERAERGVGRQVVQEAHRFSLVLQRYASAIKIDEVYRSINKRREQQRRLTRLD
jgi:hypothetical protein